MADGSEIDVGTVLGGTYQITGLIGRGGMGAVWGANHLRLPGKIVAIKVLLTGSAGDEVYKRFQREAEIATKIGHPNIVQVLDWNTLPNGTPYLVLEFLGGESLAKRLSRGPIPLDHTLHLVRQIGSALNAAHSAGIVHRDMKPDNIFLTPTDSGGVVSDHVKVLDFGISKIKNSKTVQTQEATMLGTPQYMAPEQASGKNTQIDQRTDVFALGAIVYEMLSGRAAFEGDNLAMVVFKVVFEEPTPLAELVPGLPANVINAVARAMAKEPAKRYPDVLEFVGELTGRPLATLERIQVPAIPKATGASAGVAFGSTMNAGQEAFAQTAASAPVVVPQAAYALPSQPMTAAVGSVQQPIVPQPQPQQPQGTQPVAAQPVAVKKRKTGLYLGLGLVVILGGAAAAIVASQNKSTPGKDGPAVTTTVSSGPASSVASVPATSSAATVAAASSAASAPAASSAAASSAPAVATASSEPPLFGGSSSAPATSNASSSAPDVFKAAPDNPSTSSTPAVATASSTHPGFRPDAHPTSSHKVVEQAPPPSDLPDLVDARAALGGGQWEEAKRLARHSLNTKSTPEAYVILALAACGARDLSALNAALYNIPRGMQGSVKNKCKAMGFAVPE